MHVANVAIKSRKKNLMQIFRVTFPFHSISPGWRYHKNNKELVVIKNHTIYRGCVISL